MPRYRAYEMEIESELALPELQEGRAGVSADLQIHVSAEPAPPPDRYHLALDRAETLFQNEVLSMKVRGGSAIEVAASDPDSPAVRQYVTGPGLAIALMQRGLTLLHASAVVIDGRAVAFSADSGHGKSTLAAAMHARGHALLTDDVCALDGRDALPAFALLKVADASLPWLGIGGEPLDRESEGTMRLRFRATNARAVRAPLGAVFMLEAGDDVRVKPLRGSEAVMSFVRAMYWNDLATPALRGELFQQASQLAKSTQSYTMTRPLDWTRLRETCERIEGIVAGLRLP